MAPAPEQILLNHMVRWKQTRQKYVVPGFLKNIFIINYQQKKLIGKHNHIQVDNQLFQEMSLLTWISWDGPQTVMSIEMKFIHPVGVKLHVFIRFDM